MRRPTKQRGFILVMSLLLIAIIAIVTTGLARRSFTHAVESLAGEESLQRRYGTLSCRTAFLPQAEAILKNAAEKRGDYQSTAEIALSLGHQNFRLIAGDESAKVNLNTLYERFDARKAAQTLRTLARGSAVNVTFHLRPRVKLATAGGLNESPFVSFGQLMDTPDPALLVGLTDRQRGLAADLTCWGNGRLNFRRASRAAITEVSAPNLSPRQIDQLLWIRQESPRLALDEVLRKLELAPAAHQAISSLLDNDSTCHSLWVVSETTERRSYSFFVLDSNPAAANPFNAFAW